MRFWSQKRHKVTDLDPQFYDASPQNGPNKSIVTKRYLLYSTPMRVIYTIIICILIGFVTPLLLNQNFEYSPPTNQVTGTCHIELGVRTACFPETDENVTEAMCLDRGCCYQELNLGANASLCHHRIPSSHLLNVTQQTAEVVQLVNSYAKVTWPDKKVEKPAVKARQVSPGHVGILFFDEDNPIDLGLGDNTEFEQVQLRYQGDENDDQRLRFQVSKDEKVLLDLSYGPVILGATYSELSLLIASSLVYGLGGHEFSFEGQHVFQTQTLYNTEKMIYHSHPFFMGLDGNRNFFGVYVESETPLTIEVLPGLDNLRPLIVFHSMGGYICLHIYEGPMPRDVSRQLAAHLGQPKLAPKWALGYHICRNTGGITEFKAAVQGMADAGIPYDSDCIDESLYPTAFQLGISSANLESALTILTDSDKKFLPKQNPMVLVGGPFHTGESFIMWNVTEEYQGMFGEDDMVVLPDFSHPDVASWWTTSFESMQSKLSVEVSGMTLAHNSPLIETDPFDFDCDLEELFFIPRELNATIDTYSVCPTAEHFEGSHLTQHPQYPSDHMTLADVPNTYSFSEYSSPGLSAHGGVIASSMHPTWSNMRASLKEVLELGLAGNPVVAMNPCGVLGAVPLNTSMILDQICLRWYQMASLMPAMYSFYGNEKMNRLPYKFIGSYRDWIQHSIEQRYKLMPYFHTLAHEGATAGAPIVRPLFYEFPDDPNTLRNYEQFMVGNGILVSPMMELATTQLLAYIPYGTWFGLWSGQKFQGIGDWTLLEDKPFQITSHLRAGTIIPGLEDPYMNVEESYLQSNYSLIVGLGCDKSPRSVQCTATGTMYIDTIDVSITFEATADEKSGSLVINQSNAVSECLTGEITTISSVIIYDVSPKPKSVKLSYIDTDLDVSDNPFNTGSDLGIAYYDESVGRLQITSIDLNWCLADHLQLEWIF
ncbi:lysosomal alpha-glucosidase-like isoform X1 [Tigriopus californicus]|uniref:lysosomal alpha-glucosidase-like isoform X1 n=1 Tax=Tigriopus californicus TaxID=6832 RepID=UPI0027DA17B6|nr:lysosomal alpha-glucosidase-like isoform X1 [Tigriopus californicus]